MIATTGTETSHFAMVTTEGNIGSCRLRHITGCRARKQMIISQRHMLFMALRLIDKLPLIILLVIVVLLTHLLRLIILLLIVVLLPSLLLLIILLLIVVLLPSLLLLITVQRTVLLMIILPLLLLLMMIMRLLQTSCLLLAILMLMTTLIVILGGWRGGRCSGLKGSDAFQCRVQPAPTHACHERLCRFVVACVACSTCACPSLSRALWRGGWRCLERGRDRWRLCSRRCCSSRRRCPTAVSCRPVHAETVVPALSERSVWLSASIWCCVNAMCTFGRSCIIAACFRLPLVAQI